MININAELATSEFVDLARLKKQGYESVEGAEVGMTPYLRMERAYGADTLILQGTDRGRGPRLWRSHWEGSSAHAVDTWERLVGKPSLDIVHAEVAARAERAARRSGRSSGGGAGGGLA